MEILKFTLLAFSSLLVIVDPIAAVPTFLAITPNETADSRIRVARYACLVSFAVLCAFALLGQLIFKLLGITLPAFQIAGGLLLLMVGMDMLRARRSAVHETAEEQQEGAIKEEVAVTPLAIPLLSGPGAITTVILLDNHARNAAEHLVVYLCIAAVTLATYATFWVAARGTRYFTPIAMRITTRLMGLVLSAIAVQFILSALQDVGALPK